MRILDYSHLKGRQIHQCSFCGYTGPWSYSWTWYGSLKQWDDGKELIKACSDECMQKLAIKHDLPDILLDVRGDE